MAIVNYHYGYLFLAEPHTASRSIEAALMEHEGSERVGQHDTLQELSKSGRVDCKRLNRPLYSVSCVRHPADWLVSRFQHMTGWHIRGFEAFFWNYMTSVLTTETVFKHSDTSHFIWRYESLNSCIRGFCQQFNTPPVELPRIGITQGKGNFHDYYTPLMRKYMVGRLIEDFRKYWYVLE